LKKHLIVLVGPTAVGKTELSIDLANHFNTEIISCDSRQFYRELNIGTAKPTLLELSQAKHHFINNLSIETHYSAGDYERDALKLISDLFKTHNLLIVTGGSGLFVKALLYGLDELPEVSLELREQLMQRLQNEGLQNLANELSCLDPEYASKIDLNNSQRVIRALEVCLATGKAFSEFHSKPKVNRDFEVIKIGLERDREELYERINLRMDLMLESGLIEEVKSLEAYKTKNALQTVGYKEVFEYLDGNYGYSEMVELLKRNSRRYAKRQLTWFKRTENTIWFDFKTETSTIINTISEKIQNAD
jgi:tRNA dimethylallyltransferase